MTTSAADALTIVFDALPADEHDDVFERLHQLRIRRDAGEDSLMARCIQRSALRGCPASLGSTLGGVVSVAVIDVPGALAGDDEALPDLAVALAVGPGHPDSGVPRVLSLLLSAI